MDVVEGVQGERDSEEEQDEEEVEDDGMQADDESEGQGQEEGEGQGQEARAMEQGACLVLSKRRLIGSRYGVSNMRLMGIIRVVFVLHCLCI
jgi:hypothetical protein